MYEWELTDPRLRIQAAAEWLDEKYPGWAEKIDLDDFDMGHHRTCIGAFLGVDWEFDLKRGYEADTERSGVGLFSSFDGIWREEIERRIPARLGSW